jgi:hypothetical protein
MTAKAVHTDKWPRTVRTTMRPEDDLEVTEREYQELEVQGLLAPGTTKAKPAESNDETKE